MEQTVQDSGFGRDKVIMMIMKKKKQQTHISSTILNMDKKDKSVVHRYQCVVEYIL